MSKSFVIVKRKRMDESRNISDSDREKHGRDDDDREEDQRRTEAEKLDFYSEKFDPLFALMCNKTRPPRPGARTFDNLAMYTSYIKRTNEEGATKTIPTKKDPFKRIVPGSSKEQQVNLFQRRFEPHQMPIPSTKTRKTLFNVFTRMDHFEGSEGVFGVLQKARSQNLRVTVQIRHSHGVRGVILAIVTAFDKFWNLALKDVDEYWIRKKKVKIPAVGVLSINRSFEKYFPKVERINGRNMQVMSKQPTSVQALAKMLDGNEHGCNHTNSELCYRRVNELLVRGEQVVFIAIAQGRQS